MSENLYSINPVGHFISLLVKFIAPKIVEIFLKLK